MSKHPKSRHRIPLAAYVPRSDPVDAHYQAEVDRATHKAQRRYRESQAALAQAEWDLVEATGVRARRLTRKVATLRAEVKLTELTLPRNTEDGQHRMYRWPISP
jgi:hypothetical protein